MLYEDDLFHPSNNNQDEPQQNNAGNKNNNGFFQITVKTEQKKRIIIDLFSSGHQGAYIKHAISGKMYKYLVGSRFENLFFKTSIYNGKELVSIFFKSPEEYETHMHTKLSALTKEKWVEKRLNIIY